MKNSIITALSAVLFVCVFGCQSTPNSRWLTPPKGSGGKILGQTQTDDPFFHALHPAQTSSAPAFDSSTTTEESERERIRVLATTEREGAPDFLKPLNPWDGPFANRTRSKNSEQDIIRQVGGYEHVSVKDYASEYEFDWDEEPKKGFDWSVLDPAKSFTRMRDWMGFGPDENKANEFMSKGREILLSNPDLSDSKKNLEAAKHFSDAAKKFPDSVLEEDALHLAAECYFFADDYPSAFNAYHKLVVKYQHSKHMDNAVRRLFKMGRYWELESEKGGSSINVSDKSLPSLDVFGYAKKAYETIFTYDPLGPVSDDALMALATAYLKRGRYQGDDNFNMAALYYQRLREEHPTSKHIAKAHENELFARTQAYMGAEHPNRTLNEARKLAEVTLWQFGGELDSESKASLLEMKESILTKEAERLWSMGQFWDLKKRHYGAARIEYHRLIAEYPQTEFAEMARNRLLQIEGLPDSPSIFGLPVNPFKAME